MKKAVITTGGKQYLVTEGDSLTVELLPDQKKVTFDSLLVIDGDKISVGAPTLELKVAADVVDQVRDPKVTAIRYKAKKRVKKVRGHRQVKSQIKITKIG